MNFLAPNFANAGDDPIPLQLFVKPVDMPAAAFGAAELRGVIDGLHRRVYKNAPGSDLYDDTLTPGCHPRLVPAREAGEVVSC